MVSEPIRVLIVDDSVTMRRMLTRVLEDDPDIDVVGAAPNGVVGLRRLDALKPHVIILDVHMPEMDGLEMLAHVRRRDAKLPVIMFSEATEQGAATTIDALLQGASDYLAKSTGSASPAEAALRIRDALVPKIKAVVRRVPPDAAAAARRRTAPRSGRASPTAPKAVVVASSTGGPQALEAFLGSLGQDIHLPIFIVQHVPAVFTRQLAERLALKCRRDVREGVDGAEVASGQVWVAPGDRHMVIERRQATVCLRLTDDPPENSCRPAADPLFRSASLVYGDALLCVVLTGMGADGLRGCEVARAAGAYVMVQDEPSSVVWGMPGRVAERGLADAIVPLGEIGAAVTQFIHAPAAARQSGARG